MTDVNFWVIVFFLVVVIALLIAVIYFVSNNDKKSVKINVEQDVATPTKTPMPSFSYVDFPPKIEKLSNSDLREIVRQIYKSFRYFDYQKMSLDNLEQKEWHSWQVSILLFCFKKGVDFEIYDEEKIFNDFLLKADENSLKSLLKDILTKYENYVKIIDGKDKLCKDYIWSNRDVSTIFYLLSNYKKFN